MRATTFQTTQCHRMKRKVPLTRHHNIETSTIKTGENTEINNVQGASESCNKLKSTIDDGRLSQTGATRCTKFFYDNC